MAFYVLNMKAEDVAKLSETIVQAKEKVKHCSRCFHLSADDPCEICVNDRRDPSTICVVADSRDVVALEKTREYRGYYNVLNGLIIVATVFPGLLSCTQRSHFTIRGSRPRAIDSARARQSSPRRKSQRSHISHQSNYRRRRYCALYQQTAQTSRRQTQPHRFWIAGWSRPRVRR